MGGEPVAELWSLVEGSLSPEEGGSRSLNDRVRRHGAAQQVPLLLTFRCQQVLLTARHRPPPSFLSVIIAVLIPVPSQREWQPEAFHVCVGSASRSPFYVHMLPFKISPDWLQFSCCLSLRLRTLDKNIHSVAEWKLLPKSVKWMSSRLSL